MLIRHYSKGDFEEVPILAGPLEDFEVDDWLRQRGKFSPAGRQSRPRAQVRVLLCERLGFRPLEFAMSRKSFLSVEHAIGLPSVSLPILEGNTGTQHAHLKYKKDLSGRSLTSLEALGTGNVTTFLVHASDQLITYCSSPNNKAASDVPAWKSRHGDVPPF